MTRSGDEGKIVGFGLSDLGRMPESCRVERASIPKEPLAGSRRNVRYCRCNLIRGMTQLKGYMHHV
jgi:hypothetical protein